MDRLEEDGSLQAMRILKVHNLHRKRGGENESYESENRILLRHGHVLERIEYDNQSIPDSMSISKALSLAASTIWSVESSYRVSKVIERFRPDIIHFENTYPLISPSAYVAASRLNIAVVHTVRNYRLICPSATMFRDGKPCESCLGKTPPWPGVLHSCYQDSSAKTAVTAAMLTLHRARRTWARNIDQYITPTEFVRDLIVRGGVPADRIMVKPNFVDPDPSPSFSSRSGALYVGRLSAEKGILTLLSAWNSGIKLPLRIIGDGPEENRVRHAEKHTSTISYLGRRDAQSTYDFMGSASFVVIPSEWYEPFGRVIVESFAKATPVLASRIGGIPELVVHGQTGLLYEAGNASDLAAKVNWAAEHPEEMHYMGLNARREYELKYTPERNYDLLMCAYHNAIRVRSQFA